MITPQKLDGQTFSAIVELMDDTIRESVHLSHWPCTPLNFLRFYVEQDPEFGEIIEKEFGVDL